MSELLEFEAIKFLVVSAVVIAFLLGIWVGGKFNRRNELTKADDEQPREVYVKRIKPSFRDPGRRTTTTYDKYKTREGMYAPIKPGKGSMADEREVNETGSHQ